MSALSRVGDRYRQAQDPLRAERHLELAALVCTALLILLVLFFALKLAFLAEPEPYLPAPASLVVGTAEAGDVVTAQMSNEINARPLFFPSRRPLESVVAPVVVDKSAGNKNELAKLKLLGVFGGGESAGVIVLADGKKQRLLIGESVKGWKLQSVDLSEAQFASGGKLETLVLQYSGAKAAGNGGT